MRVGLVRNPTSGGGRGAEAGAATGAELARLGHEVVDLTGSSAAGSLAAARAARDELAALVVAGGDGLVNLAANVLAGSDVPLGIVPAGTGNDVARSLGIPFAGPQAGVRAMHAWLSRGQTRAVDAVRVSRAGAGPQAAGEAQPCRWFLGVLGAGFDAVVNERANRWRRPRGRMRYNLAIARELPLFRAVGYRLELDAVAWVAPAMLVAVANTATYGGGMRIAPNARPDDGQLDVVLVEPMSLPRFVRLFPLVYAGTHVQRPEVHVRRARTVRVATADGARPVVAYADGERVGPLPLTCDLVPAAIRVLGAPAGVTRAT